MAINLQKHCDKKAMSGYGSALLYRDSGETKYHLLLPLETVPAVNGSVDTFEFDLLTCPSKGQVEGKESLDQKDVEFLWHRDNVKRLEALQGRVIDFLAVYGDLTGRKFSGTIKVRPNDVSNDVARGTFTITPISASTTTIEDVSDIIMETVAFASFIPEEIVLRMSTDSRSTTLEVKTDPTDATIKVEVNGNINADVDHEDNHKIEIIAGPQNIGHTCIVSITASKEGMASWTTTTRVVVES